MLIRRRTLNGGTRRALVLVVLLALLAAACGGDSDSTGDGAAASTTTSATEAQRGGTLRIGVVYEPPFDPNVFTFPSFPFMRNFYDPLIEFDENRKPVPWLAEEWDVADDFRSVTVTLRDDVTFWSGTPLTTATLIPTLEKGKDPARGFNTLNLLQPLESWQPIDDHTIELRFSKPLREEIVLEMLKGIHVIDPAGIDKLDQAPAGTGPFMLGSFEPGKETRLVANPDYWVEGQPVLDEVVFVKFNDRDSMAAAMQNGEVDMLFGPNPTDARRLEGQVSIVPQIAATNLYGVRVDPTRPPFDNKAFRQALNHVFDRDAMVDLIFAGYAEPAVLPWSPGNIAFDESLVEEYAFDLDRARQLVEESGIPDDGRRFSVIYDSSNAAAVLVAPILQANLAQVGVEVTPEPLDPAAFVERVARTPDYQMAISGNGHAQKFPALITAAALFRPDPGNPIWGEAVPPAYADAMNRVSDPTADLDAAVEDLKEVLLDESWAVWISTAPLLITLYSDKVTGTEPDSDEYLRLHTVGLAS